MSLQFGWGQPKTLFDSGQAKEHKADFWWLITSANIKPALNDWIRSVERTEFPFRIECLDRGGLTSAVLEHPRLLGKYFSFKLDPKDQVWTKVMSTMSNRNYQQALNTLQAQDDGVHPRTSYLVACCLSMLEENSHSGERLDVAFQYLEESHRRGYIKYLQELVGWPENKCRAQVRMDPELRSLLNLDRDRFLALFGPDNSAGDTDLCLDPETRVRTVNGEVQLIKSLKLGSKLITHMSAEPEVGKVKDLQHKVVSGTYLINSEVRASPRHRFATVDGWCHAEELRIGDVLVTLDGLKLALSSKFEIGPSPVCQMTVQGRPCFYANDYLVHNDK